MVTMITDAAAVAAAVAVAYLFSVSSALSKRFCFLISSTSASVACTSASVGSATDNGGVIPHCLGAGVAISMRITDNEIESSGLTFEAI